MRHNPLPLSRRHPQGYGYGDYFTKNRHGRSLFKIMKKLALNGPVSKWDLSSSPAKKTKATTTFSHSQIIKIIRELIENGLAKWYGKRKLTPELRKEGRKHESELFGLTDLGILLACLVDEEVYRETKTILRKYEQYEDKTKVIRIILLVKNPILELGSTGEIRTVFDPEKLGTVNNDKELYDHFFKTLSWILYDISHEYESNYEVLDKVISFIKEKGIYKALLNWLNERMSVLKIELDYFKYTAEWLKEGQGKFKE